VSDSGGKRLLFYFIFIKPLSNRQPRGVPWKMSAEDETMQLPEPCDVPPTSRMRESGWAIAVTVAPGWYLPQKDLKLYLQLPTGDNTIAFQVA